MSSINLPINVPPEYIPSKNTTIAIAVAAAATAPVLYVVAARRSWMRRARVCEGTPSILPTSLPDDAKEPGDDVIVSSERLTSIAVPVTSLRADLKVEEEGLDVVLTPYVQATMTAWVDTMGGRHVKKAMDKLLSKVADEEKGDDHELVKRLSSLSPDTIKELDFEVGDMVNGIWKVTHRGESADGGERVEFTADVPQIWKDQGLPVFNSIIVAGWEVLEPEGKEEDDEEAVNLVFTNETWMWRRKDQPKTLLEKGLGKWWHTGLAGWLIGRGIDAVTIGSASGSSKSGKSGKSAAVPENPPVVKVVPEKEEGETETETETETEASEDEE